jgi:hypothetical protein
MQRLLIESYRKPREVQESGMQAAETSCTRDGGCWSPVQACPARKPFATTLHTVCDVVDDYPAAACTTL